MTTNWQRIEKLPTNRFRNRRQHWIYGKFGLMEILVQNYDAIWNMSNFVKVNGGKNEVRPCNNWRSSKNLTLRKGFSVLIKCWHCAINPNCMRSRWGLRVRRARQSLFIKYEIIWVIVCHSCLVFVFACHRIITGRF